MDSLLDENDRDVELVQCEQVQFFRASGQMAASLSDDGQEEDDPVPPDRPAVGNPVIALFDGLPLQAHRRLQGRLIVDDPDDFEEDYPAARRGHGTAMASMILHGDLSAREAPLPRPLYVRPILRPDPRDGRGEDEVVDEGALVVDLLHRAVRRLFEGEGDEPAVAPDVAVINLSVGIRDRPFDQVLSPLARLLDWLAWRYKVLFVVSAGNHPRRITLAWISPVNPRRRNWRRAQLWFSPPKTELGVERKQADWQAVQRGTVQHEILEGESSSDFVDGANLEIQVSCRADAGTLEDEAPYALVTTIEVASDLWVSDIYEEVRAAVQAAHVHVTTAQGGAA